MDKNRHMKNIEDTEIANERYKLQKKKRHSTKEKSANLEFAFNDEAIDLYSKKVEITAKDKKSALKRLIIALGLCVLCGLCVMCYANKDKLSLSYISDWVNYDLFGKSKNETFPISIEGTNIDKGNISLISNDYLIYVSNTNSVAIKKDGGNVYSRQIRYSKPVLKADGEYSLIYNLDSDGYTLSNTKQILLDNVLENDIIFGTVNKKGDYALITTTDSYLSKLSVYNKKGEFKFGYSFSEYYAYCVDINEEGSQAVVGGIRSNNGVLQSAIYLLDFSKEEPTQVTTFDNYYVYDIKYITSDVASIIFDNNMVMYDTKNKNKTLCQYGNKSLTQYDFNDNTGCAAIVLSRNGDGRMCDIDYYNYSGEKENTISTDLKISAIDMYKDKVAVLADGYIYQYDKAGNLNYTYYVGIDVENIKMISENHIYVIGINTIRMINVSESQN